VSPAIVTATEKDAAFARVDAFLKYKYRPNRAAYGNNVSEYIRIRSPPVNPGRTTLEVIAMLIMNNV